MPQEPERKTLLIGWDAADWKTINPLLDAGKMPNLARLVEQGVTGNLATIQPVLSPMLWTSIATGKRPYKHGIHGFTEPDPVSGQIRPVTNLSRKTKAVWNIFNQLEKPTITVGWWPSNPAEPLSSGVMVSNDYQKSHGSTHEPDKWPLKPGTIHPPRLAKRLRDLRFHPAELTGEDLRPFLPGLDGMSREELDKAEKDPRIQSLAKIIADCTSVHAAATALMQNEPWDLMAVYYDAIDHFGHAFMKYHPPQRQGVSDWDFRLFNHCVEGGYRYHDMMLGTLLALAGDDTTVILISDHGFHPDEFRLAEIPREPAGPAAEHRQFGIFAAKGPGLKKDGLVYGASLLDVTPTLLQLHGLPVGADMDGRVLTGIFENPPDIPEPIPSWDDVPGDHGMHPPDRQIAPEDSQAALRQLVALGYIEEPDADQSKAIEQTVRELDYNLARSWMDGGIFTEAIAILDRLHAEWPMEHRFGFQLATCLSSLGRTAELRALVTTIRNRRLAEADDARKEIMDLKLDDPEVKKSEMEALETMSAMEKKKWSRQRRELFLKARPNLYSLRYLEATADVAEKNDAAALEKLTRLDSDFGARRNALALRGEILFRLKRWSDARSAFEEALDGDRETPGPLLGLARVFLAEKNHPQAIVHARASIGLLYFQPRAHYLLGMAHLRNGESSNAREAFLECIRQAPLSGRAWRMLGHIARTIDRDPASAALFHARAKEARARLAGIRNKRHQASPPARQASTTAFERIEFLVSKSGPSPAGQIIVVSGLPRSGTSLMMQILEAAGLMLFTDGKRAADPSNQKGYYEHEKTATLMSRADPAWLAGAKGKALKVVAPLLSSLPLRLNSGTGEPKPQPLHYRILFMERDLAEILASQAAMLDRLGKPRPTGDIAKAYQQQVRAAKNWVNAHRIPALAIDHHTLVHDPGNILPGIASFLGCESELPAMQGVIDPRLHRAR